MTDVRIVITAEVSNFDDEVINDAINILDTMLSYMFDNVIVTSETNPWQDSSKSTN